MVEICQHANCKRKALIRLYAKTVEEGPVPRMLDLCPEDADHFLHLRDERKDHGKAALAFVQSCHRN